MKTEKKFESCGDGHTTFGNMLPGQKFILIKNGETVVREILRNTGVTIFVKLWNPATWTKKYPGPAATDHPTALNISGGEPAHIADNEEVQILY